MDQPLFSCTKCLKSFPHSQMSKSATTCKLCVPFHSSYKQCDYCKSDYKQSVHGPICPRCSLLKSKYGEPKPCSICLMSIAFGNALICQRCLHYRTKFGEPRQCEQCLQICAFYKDDASRKKVDNQVLCWMCTYNFKIAKSKERPESLSSRQGITDLFITRKSSNGLHATKRHRTEEHTVNQSVTKPTSSNTYSMDSVYNEHILTIGYLQDEILSLKRQLMQKDIELLAKDKRIGELKSDLMEIENNQRDRIFKLQHTANEDINRLKESIRILQREKSEFNSTRKKKPKHSFHNTGYTSSLLTLSPLKMPLSSHRTVERLTSSKSTPALIQPVPDFEHINSANSCSSPPPSLQTVDQNCDDDNSRDTSDGNAKSFVHGKEAAGESLFESLRTTDSVAETHANHEMSPNFSSSCSE